MTSRSDARASDSIDSVAVTRACPRCGNANGCGFPDGVEAELKGDAETGSTGLFTTNDCWCMARTYPDTFIKTLPPASPTPSCYCKSCLDLLYKNWLAQPQA